MAEGISSKTKFWECDFHYTCAFDVMSLSPGLHVMMLPFATLVPFVVQAIRGGQGCGSRSSDDHGALSVSKRVLRDLVVQGIHYLVSNLAGPFHFGFIGS